MAPNKDDVGAMMQEWTVASTIPALDTPSPDDPPPDWVDKASFKRGQEFGSKNFGIIFMAIMAGLASSFIVKGVEKVVGFTGTLKSLPKCFRHIRGFREHVVAWSTTDIWDPTSPSYAKTVSVQQKHKRAGISANRNREKVESLVPDMSAEQSILDKCTMWPLVQKDFRAITTKGAFELPKDSFYLSQFDAVSVILGLSFPIVLCPEKLGLHGVSNQEMEDFLHYIRVIAYYMGVQDRYNPCAGGLDEYRSYSRKYVDAVVIPTLQNLSQEQEFYFRMIMETVFHNKGMLSALTPSTDAALLFLGWFLDVDLPNCYQHVSWFVRLQLWAFKFLASVIMQFSLMRKFINHAVQTSFLNKFK